MEEKKKDGILQKINKALLKLQKISVADKMFFAQHMSIMIKAGIPISKAVKTLSMQVKNEKFKGILLDIHKNLDKGDTLANSLMRYPKTFDELFINMIKSGEVSGKLEEVLEQLHLQLKKHHTLVAKIRNALIYPSIVLFAMTGIGIFMIVVVIPKLTSIFNEVEAELPIATKMLIAISDAVNHHGLIVVISVVSFIFLFFRVLKTKKGKLAFDNIILKLPVISPIIKKINLALFSRTISSLLKTDISIIESFRITSGVMKNSLYRTQLLAISEDIKKGISITNAMSSHEKIFPPVILQMASVGEETGTLDEILDEIAIFYEEEVFEIMTNLPSIIEPLLMLVLGAAVGFMAIAIIMPMYSLTSQF